MSCWRMIVNGETVDELIEVSHYEIIERVKEWRDKIVIDSENPTEVEFKHYPYLNCQFGFIAIDGEDEYKGGIL